MSYYRRSAACRLSFVKWFYRFYCQNISLIASRRAVRHRARRRRQIRRRSPPSLPCRKSVMLPAVFFFRFAAAAAPAARRCRPMFAVTGPQRFSAVPPRAVDFFPPSPACSSLLTDFTKTQRRCRSDSAYHDTMTILLRLPLNTATSCTVASCSQCSPCCLP